jgi:hypothetical protein
MSQRAREACEPKLSTRRASQIRSTAWIFSPVKWLKDSPYASRTVRSRANSLAASNLFLQPNTGPSPDERANQKLFRARSPLRGSVSSEAVHGLTSSNAVSLEFAKACGSRGPEHLLGYPEDALVGVLSTRTVGAYFMPANSMAEEPTMAITGRTNAICSER